MSSNEAPLPNQEITASFSDVSDDATQRDAGELVETTSAPTAGRCTDEAKPETSEQTRSDPCEAEPAGCRPAEAGLQLANVADDGFLSVTAQGGPSDVSKNEQKTPAETVKSVRDFEAFLRASGFSRADAKAIAKSGWAATSADDNGALDDLGDLIRAQTEDLKQWI